MAATLPPRAPSRDCRPLHHGAWLPDTLDHPQLSTGGQSTTQSGGRRQNSANTQKLFPEKIRCDHQTNLFDLRCCLRIRKFEVVQEPAPAFSLELFPAQSLGFCSATR